MSSFLLMICIFIIFINVASFLYYWFVDNESGTYRIPSCDIDVVEIALSKSYIIILSFVYC